MIKRKKTPDPHYDREAAIQAASASLAATGYRHSPPVVARLRRQGAAARQPANPIQEQK